MKGVISFCSEQFIMWFNPKSHTVARSFSERLQSIRNAADRSLKLRATNFKLLNLMLKQSVPL